MKIAIRIISLLLMMSMLFSMPLSAANVEKKDIAPEFQEILDFLMAFGLEKYNEDGTFSVDANVTRGEFAVMVGRMLGLDSAMEGSGAQTGFSDVPPEHFASNCIKMLTSMGLINGNSNGTFEPDRKILCGEAVKIVVCALGHDPIAQSKGGYPSGYYVVAESLGLLNGFSISQDAPITREQMDRLVYNALHSEFYKEVGFGSDVTFEKRQDVILLNEVFDVYTEKGVVTATEISSIGEDRDLDNGTAEIDGILYNTGKFDLTGYLGYAMDFYYKVEKIGGREERTLIFAELSENKVVNVSAENIIDCTDNKFSYEDESGRRKEIQINKTLDVIYNGKRITDINDAVFKPQSGYVTFISNDRDNIYDVVNVVEYKNYVVNVFDASDKKIYDKYDASKTLDLSEDIEILIIEDLDGNKMSYNSIAKENILTTIESRDGDYLKIMVSTKTITETVESISRGNFLTATIGGEKYQVAKSFETYFTRDVKVGTKAVFSLDAEGKLAASKSVDFDGGYGYLVGVYKKDEAFDSLVYLRIFGNDGEMKVFPAAEKMTVNEKGGLNTVEAYDKLSNVGALHTVVKYELDNNGNVKKIFTSGENLEFGVYKLSLTIKDEIYMQEQKTFGGKLTMKNDSVVFVVPQDKTNFKGYKISTHNLFVQDTKYSVEGYSLKKGGAYADVVVYESVVADLHIGSPYLLIESIGGMLDEEEVACRAIFGYKLGSTGGRGGATPIEIGVLDDVSLDDFAEGDLIQYAVDADGKIKEAELRFDYSERNVVATNGNNSGYQLAGRVQFGKVYQKDEDLVRITSNEITSDSTEESLKLLNFIASTFNIVVYDSTAKTEKIYSGKHTDILDYSVAKDNCTSVLIVTTWGRPTAFVVYK